MAKMPMKQAETMRAYSFPVTSLEISTGWGNLFYAQQVFTLPESLTDKKVFVSYCANVIAIPTIVNISGTNINVSFSRASSSTTTGTVYILVCD